MRKFLRLWICKYLPWKISFYLITYNESSGTGSYSFVKYLCSSALTVIFVHSSRCISFAKWSWGLKTARLVGYKDRTQLLIFRELFKANRKTKSYTGPWKFTYIPNSGKKFGMLGTKMHQWGISCWSGLWKSPLIGWGARTGEKSGHAGLQEK